MAMGSSTAMLMSAGMQAGGSIMQGNQAAGQAADEAAALDTQATVIEQSAQQAREAARIEASDFRRKMSRQFAARRAAMGASGVDLSSGSVLLAVDDFAREAKLQELRIRYGGEVQATRALQQADLIRANAGRRRTAGGNAQTMGFMRAGASLLKGIGSIE